MYFMPSFHFHAFLPNLIRHVPVSKKLFSPKYLHDTNGCAIKQYMTYSCSSKLFSCCNLSFGDKCFAKAFVLWIAENN